MAERTHDEQQNDKQKATPSGYHEPSPATAGPEKLKHLRSETPENRTGQIDPGAPNNATSEGANYGMGDTGYGGSGKPMAQPDGTAADLNQTESPPNSRSDSSRSAGGKSFRCSDVGYTECAWHVEGNNESDILPKIKQHAASVHHLEIKPEAEANVRHAIRDAA